MNASLKLRLLTREDLPFADSVRAFAGWNQTIADWERFLAAEADGCFLAGWNGAPAGTATAIAIANARLYRETEQRRAELERSVRAYDPWPGVRLPLAGEPVRILRAGLHLAFMKPRSASDLGVLGRQVLEKGLGLLQIGCAEAPGESSVGVGQHPPIPPK